MKKQKSFDPYKSTLGTVVMMLLWAFTANLLIGFGIDQIATAFHDVDHFWMSALRITLGSQALSFGCLAMFATFFSVMRVMDRIR